MARCLAILAVFGIALAPIQDVSGQAVPPRLTCDVGPAAKTYGNTPWLVYSCSDSRSVVVLAAPGNPATPFYFILHPGTTGYQIEGEGTGDKGATDAAFVELKKLSEHDISALIQESKQH